MARIEFSRGTGNKKYKAVIYEGGKKIKTVQFGDKRYQHYKDTALKYYSKQDHLDKERRRKYRARHQGILNKEGLPVYTIKYTPSWFSYNYLW